MGQGAESVEMAPLYGISTGTRGPCAHDNQPAWRWEGREEETLNSTHQHVSQGVNNSIGILAEIQAWRPRVGEEYPYECL